MPTPDVTQLDSDLAKLRAINRGTFSPEAIAMADRIAVDMTRTIVAAIYSANPAERTSGLLMASVVMEKLTRAIAAHGN